MLQYHYSRSVGMKKISIFGHKNPDTDSVCGAISLSYLKNKLGYNTVPRIIGDINDETKFVLDYFDVPVPKFLNNVKVKIKDVFYHKDFYVKYTDSIYNVYSFMNERNITGVPLVDNDKKFDFYSQEIKVIESYIFSVTGKIKHLAINGDWLLTKGIKGVEIGTTLQKALTHVINFPEQNTVEALSCFLNL